VIILLQIYKKEWNNHKHLTEICKKVINGGVIQSSGRRITPFTPSTEPVPKNMAQIGKAVFQKPKT
jgi:hypothetical protein